MAPSLFPKSGASNFPSVVQEMLFERLPKVQVLRKSFALQLTLTQIPRCAQGAIVFGLARKRTRVAEALANTLSCTSDELVRFKPHPVGISSVITASVFKHHG